MHGKDQVRSSIFRTIAHAATVALAMGIVFALTVLTQSAEAQTAKFKVIYNFTGGADGGGPAAGLMMDSTGNLYGTASGFGAGGNGTIFKMSHRNGGWQFTTLYSFTGGYDGSYPEAGVVFGPYGGLYGTTGSLGGGSCCGTVFETFGPSRSVFGFWWESPLYDFRGGTDGKYPGYGDVTFDLLGNVYGVTQEGGDFSCLFGCGTVFCFGGCGPGLIVLYSFSGGDDGEYPAGNVIFDQSGNLYGTTSGGGTYGCGTVFQLTPPGSGWTEKTLYAFNPSLGDGCVSVAALIFDQLGNLYGTNSSGGLQGGGTVFELTPHQDGTWTEAVLYSFAGDGGPWGSLTMDAAGNLYGTTQWDGAYGGGNVFKLKPSNGGWEYTSLHDFYYFGGYQPWGGVVLDASGNLYGTAHHGGTSGNGTVWEITP